MNEKEEMILNFMKDEDYVPMKAKRNGNGLKYFKRQI